MNFLSPESSQTLCRCRRFFVATTLRGFFERSTKVKFVGLLACLAFLVPIGIHGQDASDIANSRLACAEGVGQQAVNRARSMGLQMGLVDVCVKALNWMASNGKLLDLYSGQGDPRQLVNAISDKARSSTGPFQSSGSPQEMLNNGQLIPSLAFDAGFTRSFLERTALPSGSMDAATLKSRTEACLSENQSLAACAEVGRIQGAMAYQVANAFSNPGSPSTPRSQSQGPDRAQAEAAVDQKFRAWSQGWSMDRYSAGSARVSNIDCSGQCKASGQFTFTRFGMPHTIPFVAFLQSDAAGRVSLARLCYDDDTTGSRDCTE